MSSSRLEAAAVVAGRLAEVLGAVAAEVGERGEIHAVGYLRERIESRHGIHTIEHAEKIGLGSRQYKLVSIDGKE